MLGVTRRPAMERNLLELYALFGVSRSFPLRRVRSIRKWRSTSTWSFVLSPSWPAAEESLLVRRRPRRTRRCRRSRFEPRPPSSTASASVTRTSSSTEVKDSETASGWVPPWFLKVGQPGLFFVYFPSFQTNNTFLLQKINVKKCPSSIRRRDLNPRPFEQESSLITTRPGLPGGCHLFAKSSLSVFTIFSCLNRRSGLKSKQYFCLLKGKRW